MTNQRSGRADPLLRAATRPATVPPPSPADGLDAGRPVPGGLGSRPTAAPPAGPPAGPRPANGNEPGPTPARAGSTESLPANATKSGGRPRKPPRRSGRRLEDRSDSGLLAELRRVADLIEGALPRTAFDRVSRINSDAISRRFGGWDRALARAGLGHRDSNLQRKRTLRLTDRQVLDRLRRAATRDGVVTQEAVGRTQGLFRSIFVRRFGSWQAAVRRAGLCLSRHATPGPRRRRTPEERHRIPMMLRFQILKRDDYRCALCGDSPAITKGTTLEVDHIHPFSQGGKTVAENLRTLCRRCNQGKGAAV